MTIMIRMLNLIILLVGFAQCFEYEHVDDSCNSIAKFMSRKPDTYEQRFSAEPETPLQICNAGKTCCTTAIEEYFYEESNTMTTRISFLKDPYLRKTTQAKENIADYMTQLLTYASSHNERTRGLVSNFLEMSKYKVQTIDVMKYPVFILMDIAQSNGVKDLLNSTNCIAEMRDYLHPLAALQVDALKIGRLINKAIPLAEAVMKEMKHQTVSEDCIKQIVKSQRCNECRDSTDVKPCRPYCMEISKKCFSHLTAVSGDWERFVGLISLALNKTDQFAKVYKDALSSSIRNIVTKLSDTETADMCGYDVSGNLAAKHKRSASRNSGKFSSRSKLLDERILKGMLGLLAETHCLRYSTEEIKCWNGSEVGLFTGSSDDIEITNEETVTEGLIAALDKINKFNEQFKQIENIEIKGVEYNVAVATEEPEFVVDKKPGSSAVQTALLSLGLFLVSLILH